MPYRKSPLPLRNCCWKKITRNYHRLKDKIAELPFTFHNELYQHHHELERAVNLLPSSIFINPVTTKLKICPSHTFDISTSQLYVKIQQVCCKNLTHLDFNNQVDIEPKLLEKLIFQIPNILYLNLRKSNCNDAVLHAIGKCCFMLQHLDLSFCTEISDLGIRHLCVNDKSVTRKLKIIHLNISKTVQISCKGFITVLKHLAHLKIFLFTFDFDNTSGIFFMMLAQEMKSNQWRANSLEIFSDSKYIFTKRGLAMATECFPNLKSLSLQASDINLEDLVNFRRLKCLTIRGHEISISSSFLQIIANRLTCLCLNNLKDIDISVVAHYSRMLKRLDLWSVTTSKVWSMDLNLSNLKSLQVYRSDIQIDNLFKMLVNSRNLEILFLSECKAWTNNLIGQLAKSNSMRCLKTVTIQKCHKFTITSLIKLLDMEIPLKKLNLFQCRKITESEKMVLQNYIKKENFDLNLRVTLFRPVIVCNIL